MSAGVRPELDDRYAPDLRQLEPVEATNKRPFGAAINCPSYVVNMADDDRWVCESGANRTSPGHPRAVLAAARAGAVHRGEGPGHRPVFGYVAAALVLVVAGAAVALAVGIGEGGTDVATAPEEDPDGAHSATLARSTGVVAEAGGYLWVLGGYFDGPDFRVPERGRVPNTAVTVHDGAGDEVASVDLPIGDEEFLYDPGVVAADGRFYVVANVCPLPTGEIAVCVDSKGTVFVVDLEGDARVVDRWEVPAVSGSAGLVKLVGATSERVWVSQTLGEGEHVFTDAVRLVSVPLDGSAPETHNVPDAVRTASSACASDGGVHVLATDVSSRGQVLGGRLHAWTDSGWVEQEARLLGGGPAFGEVLVCADSFVTSTLLEPDETLVRRWLTGEEADNTTVVAGRLYDWTTSGDTVFLVTLDEAGQTVDYSAVTEEAVSLVTSRPWSRGEPAPRIAVLGGRIVDVGGLLEPGAEPVRDVGTAT